MTSESHATVVRNPVRAVRRAYRAAFPGAVVAVSPDRYGNLEVVIVWARAVERLGMG